MFKDIKNFFKKEDPNKKALLAQVGDVIDNETVIGIKPCQDESGMWRKLTTETENGEQKVYEVWSTSEKVFKRLHVDNN